jgi:hypothetical protein
MTTPKTKGELVEADESYQVIDPTEFEDGDALDSTQFDQAEGDT